MSVTDYKWGQMQRFQNMGSLVEFLSHKKSNPKALNVLENNQWVHFSTKQFLFDVKRIAYTLLANGLKRGEKVGILGCPSPKWSIVDLAIGIAGGVSVPLFGNISSENFVYEVAFANVKTLFVEGEMQWEMCLNHRNLFDLVIAMDGSERGDVLLWHAALQAGEEHWHQYPDLLREIREAVSPDDLCTIIYTSGSLGMPKGVELSHKNLLHLITPDYLGWNPESDVYLSLLPLAHVFGRQLNLIMIGWGVSVYYLNDFSLFSKVCSELKPTLTSVVPRILDKMHANLLAMNGVKKNTAQNKLLAWALAFASQERHGSLQKYFLLPLFDRLIYRKIRENIGDRWRMMICGGAALNPAVHRFFLRIGLPIYEGWGLSEASTTTLNFLGSRKIGTVGLPVPGVKVKVGKDNELLLKGPTVMKSYHRNPAATEKVFDKAGWLRTGDQGEIDQDGFVKITGRLKRQCKLSTGEYLCPERLEQFLCQSPLIDMAVAVGEGRKFAAALLFVDGPFAKKMRAKYGLEDLSDDGFAISGPVVHEIENFIGFVNERLNHWERIVKYRLIFDRLSIGKGELTPTLIPKREVIVEKYKSEIQEMYES